MTKQKIMLKKLSLLILVFLMVLSNAFVVNANVNNDNEIRPFYVNILRRDVSLNISGIKAECTASLRANKSMTLKIKMELQKSKSNGYETVETWTSSKTGTYLTMSESRNINIFSDYRLKVTFTAGSETEIVYKYWQEISCNIY